MFLARCKVIAALGGCCGNDGNSFSEFRRSFNGLDCWDDESDREANGGDSSVFEVAFAVVVDVL
jgi:hypothetical protein